MDIEVTLREFSVLSNGKSAGWDIDNYEALGYTKSQTTVKEACWDSSGAVRWSNPASELEDEQDGGDDENRGERRKRQNNSFPSDGDYRGLDVIPDITYLINKEASKEDSLTWRCAGGCGYQCYATFEIGDACCDCA